MRNTRERNGVLIYIAVVDKKFAIFGDEGIHKAMGFSFWTTEAATLKTYLSDDKIVEGVCKVAVDIGEALQSHFPVIAPSMLKCDFGDLRREIELLDRAAAPVLHWDVMDGHFVPNLSYGAMLIERVRPLTRAFAVRCLLVDTRSSRWDQQLSEGKGGGCDRWQTVTGHWCCKRRFQNCQRSKSPYPVVCLSNLTIRVVQRL